MRPSWDSAMAPRCEGQCQKAGSESTAPVQVSEIDPQSQLADAPLSLFGIGPLGHCVVEDDESELVRVYELPGELEDIVHRVTR